MSEFSFLSILEEKLKEIGCELYMLSAKTTPDEYVVSVAVKSLITTRDENRFSIKTVFDKDSKNVKNGKAIEFIFEKIKSFLQCENLLPSEANKEIVMNRIH